MNRKLTSALLLASALSLISYSAVADSSNGKGNSKETFTPSGVRSHGYPVANWKKDVSGTPAENPGVGSDKANADELWLSYITKEIRGSARSQRTGGTATNPISCHLNCTTYTGSISIIPVWVGNWNPTTLATWNSTLGNLVNTFNASQPAGHIFNTNVQYFTLKGKAMPSLRWVGNTVINAPSATSVTDAQVADYINSFITAGTTPVPAGTKPMYVYIGADSTLLSSGFGTRYCGWHTYEATTSYPLLPYIAIQDFGTNFYSACSSQNISPNGNVTLDAMASVFAHEVDEAITDPQLNAWYDAKGAENADKCAWTFGNTSTLPSGAKYNTTLGGVKYLIQQNWLANNLVTTTGAATGTACSVN